VAIDFSDVLAGIVSCADLIRTDANSSSLSLQCADLILESSKNAANRIQQLLGFSYKPKIKAEPVDLHACIRSTVQNLFPFADKRIEFSTHLGALVSTTLGDHRQVENALYNLGMNAVEAMPNGGTVTFRTRNIEVDESFLRKRGLILSRGFCVEVSVEDTGIGMDQEMIGRVFDPFFTTKNTSAQAGMGLTSVYGIIKQYNGDIAIASKQNQGTMVSLYLPAYEIDAAA